MNPFKQNYINMVYFKINWDYITLKNSKDIKLFFKKIYFESQYLFKTYNMFIINKKFYKNPEQQSK